MRKAGDPVTETTGELVNASAKLPLIQSSFSPRSLRVRRRSKTLFSGFGNLSNAARISAISGFW